MLSRKKILTASSPTSIQKLATRIYSESSQRQERDNLSGLVAQANTVNANVIYADEVATSLQSAMRRPTLTEVLLGKTMLKAIMRVSPADRGSHTQPLWWNQKQLIWAFVTYVDWSPKKILGKGGTTHGLHLLRNFQRSLHLRDTMSGAA